MTKKEKEKIVVILKNTLDKISKISDRVDELPLIYIKDDSLTTE